MSKKNAVKFMMAKSKDEKIKSDFDAILCKYQGKNLSSDEQDNMLEEIRRLAEEYGYDFSPEDLMELQKNAEGKLSDDDLSEVTGGKGCIIYSPYWWQSTDVFSCEYVKDDVAFLDYYLQKDTNCPDYEERTYGICGSSAHQCSGCTHFRCD
ncbi:MAG: hypothetical protein VB070_00345 [Clostridiaceae bacterium]|nr:hypothetical protein [Clostridiaceae bacterium]